MDERLKGLLMKVLKNCWYAGGFAQELSQEPIARVFFDTPVVLYRTSSGDPVMLADRCPHRFAPLHEGKVFGDAIRCPYHGLRFGPDGGCVDNPMGDGKIPKSAKVKSYPVRELDGIIWFWYGDNEPDESKIVRFDVFNQPDKWTTVQGTIPIAANYTLVSDNLMDLGHAEFLHPALATEGANKRVKFTVEQDGDVVVAKNKRESEPIPPAFAMALGPNAPDFIDHDIDVVWHAPATLRLSSASRPVGHDIDSGVRAIQAHMVTPESESTCWYFWKFARNNRIGDEAFSVQIQAVIDQAFRSEDKPMIEAQQRYMEGKLFEDLKPVLLTSDAAAMRVRRVHNALIDAQAE